MILFPPAKINLGLRVLRRRSDGYHDIESVFFHIPLHDVLEAVADAEMAPGEVAFTRTGLPVPGNPADDLCLKAVEAINRKRKLPGLRMHLHKAIPAGAGLGGGSSDAAYTLLLLNELYRVQIEADELHELATELGSDCPFFLGKGPQLAEGRGERLRPMHLDLKGHWLVLAHPGIHVSTAEVYMHTRPEDHRAGLAKIVNQPVAHWQGELANDMEAYVFAKHPEVAAIKQKLLDCGALFAAMSGSGSSVFGLFAEPPELPVFPEGHRTWTLKL